MSKLQLALNAHQKNDFSMAEKLYAEILKTKPNNSIALHHYGLIEAQKNKNTRGSGLSYMEKSLTIQPNNASFNHNIAEVYLHNGFIQKAIHHFKRAIELKPDYGEAYQGLTKVMVCKN